MKVGLCAWEFIEYATRPRRYQSGRPVASTAGLPDEFLPHPGQPEIDLEDPLGWLIRHCGDYGVEAVETSLQGCADDPQELARIQRLADEHGVTLATNYDDDFIEPSKTIEDFERYLRAVRELGIGVIGVGGMPFTVNRFVDDPPLEKQLEIIVEHLKPWVAAAHDFGVTLAFENHADYRCAELVEHVIEPIGAPNLGIKLDTGNCLLVIEDPVDAARLVAPICHAAHWKDMYVHPVTPLGGLIVGAPIGLGHCRLGEVAQILRETAPHPDELVLSIEINWMPDSDDYFQWLRESARWCAEQLPASGGKAKEEQG